MTDGRTDGQTDGQTLFVFYYTDFMANKICMYVCTSCHGIVRAMHTRRAVKAVAGFVVAVEVCRRFGLTILSPFWLSPFWLVAVIVCRRFDDTPSAHSGIATMC